MVNKNLIIDSLIVIDDTGMPVPPTTRQLIDRDIRELYRRDKTPDKKNYIAECIVIYYLGDPKSPARQAGLSEPEALKMAIEQTGLPRDYIPDALVLRLIKRYYEENITEAGRVVENIMQGIHNINLSISAINNILNEKLNSSISIENIADILSMVDNVNKKAGELPSILKKLEEAKENLLYEKETELSRGGNIVLSSMDAEGV
jgi:hypothetical protein